MQLARRALSLALAKTGNRMAARIEIIAITTNNSINVKPVLFSEVRITSPLQKLDF
jgi:hypothetical protein